LEILGNIGSLETLANFGNIGDFLNEIVENFLGVRNRNF
jgi:hypothetical protein